MKKLSTVLFSCALAISAQVVAAPPADINGVGPGDKVFENNGNGPRGNRDRRGRPSNNWNGDDNRAAPQDPTDAVAAHAAHQGELYVNDNVIGSGVSWDAAGTPVIKVFTKRKENSGNGRGRGRGAGSATLPGSIGGFEVVTEVAGGFFAMNVSCADRPDGTGCEGDTSTPLDGDAGEAASPQDWHIRPVPIGVSIGAADLSAGTLGCRVSQGCHKYALSNSHVAGSPGDALIQPAALDGGMNPDDAIATLFAAAPITMGTGSEIENKVDAAIFAVNDGAKVGTATRSSGYGEPKEETLDAALDMNVTKYGRSSAMTSGYIDTIAATVLVSYESGDARFVDQIVIKSDTTGQEFTLPGDSGSLVVADGGDDDRKPVGLVFASGRNLTVANPINDVLAALDINIDGEF
jgi:hypothetical protein